jgi:pimeloyl-ACP methyl ester carboxylesterase
MRAREPDRSGFAEHDGVRLAFEVFGEGEPTILFLPNAPIVHSKQWKAQVPYLARHARVVTFDGRGNGRSDRPTRPADYTVDAFARDLLAVMDASDTDRCVFVTLCHTVAEALLVAADQPDRVLGIVSLHPGIRLVEPPPDPYDFEAVLDTDEGWAKANRHYWLRDYAGWANFWSERIFPEPHSTKQIEDCTAWMLDSTAEINLAAEDAPPTFASIGEREALVRRIACPMLVVGSDLDECQGFGNAERLSSLAGVPLVRLEGVGHVSPARHPVRVNLLIRDFVRSITRTEVATGVMV